jgi:hypothetical protein
LHTALGRRALYLRRYYLTPELPLGAEFAGYLTGEHPGLMVLQAEAAALSQLAETAAATGEGEPAYYLVDKQGYIMMYYTATHSGQQVIDDIKFLMKQTGDD